MLASGPLVKTAVSNPIVFGDGFNNLPAIR